MAYLEPTQKDLEHISLPWSDPPFCPPNPYSYHNTSCQNMAAGSMGTQVVLQTRLSSWISWSTSKAPEDEYNAGGEEQRLLEEH